MGKRRDYAERANALGLPRFYYPHAARPPLYWDGVVEPVHPHAASFVTAEGHRLVMEAYGYPYPVHVTGWGLCKQRPFRSPAPKDRPRVLFGPIHPGYNSWLAPELITANQRAYCMLLTLFWEGKIELSVRHVENLAKNGLFPVEGVGYEQSARELRVQQLDAFDVVVSHQTLAYLAIARGIPTLMYAEHLTPSSGNSPASFVYVASWDAYRELLTYPLDLFSGPALDMLEAAMQPNEDVARWRELFIGGGFEATRFVDLIEANL